MLENNDLNGQPLPTHLIGKSFNFDITEIQKVTIKRHETGRAYSTIWYVFVVKSPDLMQLKNKYVPSAYKKIPLHISFAVARLNDNGRCYTPSWQHHDHP